MDNYQIYPLLVGEFKCAENYNFVYQKFQKKTFTAPVISFLIKGPDNLILMDTGGCDEVWADKYHVPLIRTEDMKVENGLKRLGVNPGDIDIVVNSHLHWDHCYNNDLFKNARVYVQSKEVEFALAPIPSQYAAYEAYQTGMTPCWENSLKRFEYVDGDFQLQDGIRLVVLPGHSPGFQGILVDTPQGRCLLAGDCIPTMENWEDRLYGLPRANGVHVDLISYYEALRKALSICNFIIPGHDHKVFAHRVYPVPA